MQWNTEAASHVEVSGRAGSKLRKSREIRAHTCSILVFTKPNIDICRHAFLLLVHSIKRGRKYNSSGRDILRCDVVYVNIPTRRERMVVFHYHALAIQGAFRGYQSRKYNYNHARRKGYLQEVYLSQGSPSS